MPEHFYTLDAEIPQYNGDYFPKMVIPAVLDLEKLLKEEDIIFEWGSGASTLWFAKRVKKVISIEGNRMFYREMKSRVPKNVDLYYVNENNPVEYSNAINKFDLQFDGISIDGEFVEFRNMCVVNAIPHLTKDGWVVLDDTHHFGTQTGVQYLEGHDFTERRYDHLGDLSGRWWVEIEESKKKQGTLPTTTSIFTHSDVKIEEEPLNEEVIQKACKDAELRFLDARRRYKQPTPYDSIPEVQTAFTSSTLIGVGRKLKELGSKNLSALAFCDYLMAKWLSDQVKELIFITVDPKDGENLPFRDVLPPNVTRYYVWKEDRRLANVICQFKQQFDIIVLDHIPLEPRNNLLKLAVKKITENGILVVDDTNAEQLQEGLTYIRHCGFQEKSYGIAVASNWQTGEPIMKGTSVFYREHEAETPE